MDGAAVFPSIALILFLGFFVCMLVYLGKKGKNHWKEASRIPLETKNSTDNH